MNEQFERGNELIRVSCQVGAVIGPREASERIGSNRNPASEIPVIARLIASPPNTAAPRR